MASSPIKISEKKYRIGIRCPQQALFPLKNNQAKMGIFKYHGIFFLQWGQKEAGCMTDCSLGQRSMQTERKLPMQLPKTNKTKKIHPIGHASILNIFT